MSTQSYICRENKDNTYTGIYCHWDGYPIRHGRILTKHYDTPEKVEALLSLGDLSELDVSVESCVAYHRDRDEELSPPSQFSLGLFRKSCAEFMYVFGLDSKWRYFDCAHCGDGARPLNLRKEWAIPHYYEYLVLEIRGSRWQALKNGADIYIDIQKDTTRKKRGEKDGALFSY